MITVAVVAATVTGGASGVVAGSAGASEAGGVGADTSGLPTEPGALVTTLTFELFTALLVLVALGTLILALEVHIPLGVSPGTLVF